MAGHPSFQFNDIHRFMQSLFGEDLHAKRVYSLANATLDVINSASLAVHVIGQGLAHARGLMKEPWCLAASEPKASASALTKCYGKRWGIECGVRDTEDLRYGMGMYSVRIDSTERRDRLWLLK